MLLTTLASRRSRCSAARVSATPPRIAPSRRATGADAGQLLELVERAAVDRGPAPRPPPRRPRRARPAARARRAAERRPSRCCCAACARACARSPRSPRSTAARSSSSSGGVVRAKTSSSRSASCGLTPRMLRARSPSTRRSVATGARRASEPALQHRFEILDAQRLAEVVVHAGAQAALAVALERVRGHRHDRGVAAGRLAGADPGGRLVAVEVRHLAVHEDRVMALRDPGARRPPGRRRRRRRRSRGGAAASRSRAG